VQDRSSGGIPWPGSWPCTILTCFTLTCKWRVTSEGSEKGMVGSEQLRQVELLTWEGCFQRTQMVLGGHKWGDTAGAGPEGPGGSCRRASCYRTAGQAGTLGATGMRSHLGTSPQPPSGGGIYFGGPKSQVCQCGLSLPLGHGDLLQKSTCTSGDRMDAWSQVYSLEGAQGRQSPRQCAHC
jgi:hypothetical protein